MAHAVHAFPALWIGTFGKYALFRRLLQLRILILIRLPRLKLRDIDLITPMPMYLIMQIRILLTFTNRLGHFSFALELLTGHPSFLVELNGALYVGLSYKPDGEGAADVDVGSADDEVVDAQGGRDDLVSFVVLLEVDVRPVLLVEVHALASELCICLLIIPENIIGLEALAVVGGDWRMVRDLLGEELEVVGEKFVGFTQKRVEWLGCISFDLVGHRAGKDTDVGQSLHLVVFDCIRLINNIIILHRLRTSLQQTRGTIEVYWHGQLRNILANGILDDGPYAHFDVGVFEPGKLGSFEWFIILFLSHVFGPIKRRRS